MKQVIEKIATDFNVTKKVAKELVESVVEGLVNSIKTEDKVRANGLGTFSRKEKPARKARNPKTGETIDVPAKTVVKFTVAKDLKESLK